MKISEIFKSIEGEGIRAGYPAVFIRTFLCNCRCIYCDSKYTWEGLGEYTEMSVDDIIKEVDSFNIKRVTFTGGEPLMFKDEASELINKLIDKGYEVNVETNGTIDPDEFLHDDSDIIYTMDWKSPSSGMNKRMNIDYVNHLHDKDVLKFVVGSKEDLDDMKHVLSIMSSHPHIFVSPIFEDIEPSEIVEYILENNLVNVRMQLQIHKFIWDPNARGV